MAGRNIIEDLTGLKQPRRGTFSTVKKQPQRVLVSAAGIGLPKSSPVGGGGNGGSVNFPLTETGIDDRQYYGNNTVYSSDGIFSFNITPIKKLRFMDTLGVACEFFFKPDPPPT